ncbi:hypothetical protein CMQ_1597 [Grosmannia clavigera kw1407]|uniref:Uncharacterized protein n=1 Tax=Grosmannia clavigera (strain kw1407 / UAMH 11150) TaxID=655863 RepID=F0XCQ7_GROCL|nr:uncharacterized protein CMQ_1597 [Grosmannia clavigera kw1407]EFX04669.1 hypothetical protein CMQ_1597 [Grosmannia clavigera kw1407]
MAEVSSETIVPVQIEEADYTFGSPSNGGNTEDDFDFDLGDDKTLGLLTENGDDYNTEVVEDFQSHMAQAEDEDEIGYEGGGAPVGGENGDGDEHAHDETGHDDEIDYDEADLQTTSLSAGNIVLDEKQEVDTAEEAHDAIDFETETNRAAPNSPEHDVVDEASTADVTVTWGTEVCPLFKTSEVDSPDSFFLEDLEAANYPLSKFLLTIRSGIASWVHAEDEIFIRIDDLGFEFGETTTEALLDQVTFHNLIALHNTLLTNDDATLSKGLHITLGTRPNCLLRLKKLVSEAGSGKGLSSCQQTAADSDASSDSDDHADKSDEQSSDNGLMDRVEEEEGGALTPEAEMADVDVTVEETEPFGGEGAELATAEDGTESVDHDVDVETEGGHGVEVAAEEAELVDFTNEEEDDTGGVSLRTTGGLELARGGHTPSEASNGHFEQQSKLSEHETAEEVGNPDQHLKSDIMEPLDQTGGSPDQEKDGELYKPVLSISNGGISDDPLEDSVLAHLEPANGLEAIDQGHQLGDLQALGEEDNGDGFLDVSGDFDAVLLPTTVSEWAGDDKAALDEMDLSLDASVTATLDHDEIDYEDRDTTGLLGTEFGEDARMMSTEATLHNTDVPESVAAADAGPDEIDWDDDDKNGAASETASTSATATGKRTRIDEGLEDYLIDDLPGKRHFPDCVAMNRC